MQVVELVGEVEDELFGLLSAYARHTLKRCQILVAQRPNEAVGGEGRQQAERQRRADALRVEHPLKDAPLVRTREPVELPAVVLHDEVRVQRRRLAGARQ